MKMQEIKDLMISQSIDLFHCVLLLPLFVMTIPLELSSTPASAVAVAVPPILMMGFFKRKIII